MDDPFDLARFVKAQDPVYGRVVQELRAGKKQTHWMWFIFPQIAGLGSSFMAQRFAISGLEEARAYLAHPLLGGRLRECTGLVLAVEGRTIHEIFGSPDDVKFRSCMTLFEEAESETAFKSALEKFFGGVQDEMTLQLLR
ncbi:MAG TPA: DUF1810 domain-containing protein [Rhizomicrobium sp.]|jgi:uncharacterized protein (DUF1810 family)|nr:DUF1810 domain-containing protein [Rhizomicrobium sp.]